MNTTTDLGTTPMKRLVLQLALPSMAAQFVNVLYSIIDRMYIGHISGDGALALAGAGVCGPVVKESPPGSGELFSHVMHLLPASHCKFPSSERSASDAVRGK